MKKLIPLFIFVIIVLIVIAVKQMIENTPKTHSDKLQVVTSIYPLYYFASQIGGNKTEVYNVVPAGAEPHEYEPTAQDIARIETSDILIVNGAKLEPWAGRIKKELQGKRTMVITLNDDLTDPHVWLSPPRAKEEIEKITQAFIQTDIENTDYYQANASLLISRLDDLNNKFVDGLSQCRRKDIITSHAAFGYLAQTYGLRQIPIAGISTSEPSIKQLSQIADFAHNNNVKYIFVERLVSPKFSDTLAQEVGAQTLVLDPLEGISEHDMKAGKNYFTIMQDNLTNLRIALECL